MKNLTCQQIQVPTFETCKKLKELGVLPPTQGKSNVYFKNKQGVWYFSDDRWDLNILKNAVNNESWVFAPDLGQLRNLLNTSFLNNVAAFLRLFSNNVAGNPKLLYYRVSMLKAGKEDFSPIFLSENEAEAAGLALIWAITYCLNNE